MLRLVPVADTRDSQFLAKSSIPVASPEADIGLVDNFSECLQSRPLPNSHSRPEAAIRTGGFDGGTRLI